MELQDASKNWIGSITNSSTIKELRSVGKFLQKITTSMNYLQLIERNFLGEY